MSPAPSPCVIELDRQWRSVCKVVLGEDIGPMEDYAGWLRYGNEPITPRHSVLSGRELVSSPPHYAPGGKWMAFDETDFNKKFEPVGLNQMKDIDSLVEAVQERLFYAGNIYFGQSGFIENSSNINDSFYVYNTASFGNSKHLAYSRIGRHDEACFGCHAIDNSSHCLKCTRSFKNTRSFELWMSQNCSACYYSFGLENVNDALFCFNLRNKRNAIGNLELAPDKFRSLKSKLLSEVLESLKSSRSAPTLLDISQKCKPCKPGVSGVPSPVPNGTNALESVFSQTTQILLGQPLEGGIDRYAKWLSKHTRPPQTRQSAADGRTLLITPYANYQNLPQDRLLGMEEARLLGEKAKMALDDVESLSLQNAHTKIAPLAFFNVEMMQGSNLNLCDCSIAVDSANCYKSTLMEFSKNCGYSFWMHSCKDSFGSDGFFDSLSSIHVYWGNTQSRCLETDCSGHCYDSYFLHNCENVRDSMFCFGVKNRKYCIGNAELEEAEYKKIKSALLAQMHSELSSKKDLQWDIYNVGCPQKE
ncbi:Uncharacterised protein [uncultured archaeon]|nr:Uncharacterised protein [uncultured archaeon]